ncbi:S1 RNA-binding domain-containing protein [Fodinicola acaciae]|uniref:S1 RNA-binding domain-containing protein n=1 Tax=Fodinicola acaciae TaxID=2681555 RepID=UPI0013D01899
MSRHTVSLESWTDFVSRHAAGGVLAGRVSAVVPFGVFVEVADGIEGLLPRGNWLSERTERAIGSTVSVRIDVLDPENRRVSLVEMPES